MTNLYDYQQRAVDAIVERKRLGLFLGMGLGKTLITLTAIARLDVKALVIAPLRVARYTWSQENEKFNIGLRVSVCVGNERQRREALDVDADIYVINRDMTTWLFEQKRLPAWSMLVVDESTSFKNPGSKRWRTLKKQKFDRVLLLTGTPVANNLLDLWAQVYLLDRGARLETCVTRYRQKYFYLYRTINNVPIYKDPFPWAKDRILELIKDITVTMRSEDYLQLPPFRIIDQRIDIPVMREYEEMKREYVYDHITAANAAVVLGKCQQIANGFLYGSELRHAEKVDAVKELLEIGEPLLVYYTYEEDKRRLLELGGVEITDENIEAWNRGEIKMLVAHPQAAGLGLNLQAGGHVIVWYSMPWSYELYSQGIARLYRPGQRQKVVVYRLIASGTVDEIVAETLEHKQSVSDSLLDTLKREYTRCK